MNTTGPYFQEASLRKGRQKTKQNKTNSQCEWEVEREAEELKVISLLLI